MTPNNLIPMIGVVTDIRTDTPDIKTFRVEKVGGGKCFEHQPGQCAMLSIPGVGEAMFSITSSPTLKEYQEFSIKKCGCLSGWLHLMEKFNDKQWENLSRACLACGTCTFVCPTCQCYDIRDFDNGKTVTRYRCWDSCMYSDFTLMAHGNNRQTQAQRFRQRFMHKLVYFPSNNEGIYSCVGCGRCVEKCPQNLNIVKVIKALGVKEK